MGTNYYLHTAMCPHCRRSDPPLHIGKSSGGWCFALHVDPDRGINDLDQWKALFDMPEAVIKNEYGDTVSRNDMISEITNRQHESKRGSKPFGYNDWEEFHRKNFSEEGPNGLLRSKVEGNCIKHGEGTWDCIVGEFS